MHASLIGWQSSRSRAIHRCLCDKTQGNALFKRYMSAILLGQNFSSCGAILSSLSTYSAEFPRESAGLRGEDDHVSSSQDVGYTVPCRGQDATATYF